MRSTQEEQCSQMQAAGHKNRDGEKGAARRRKWGNVSRAEAATSFITSEADCQGVALSGHTLDLHTESPRFKTLQAEILLEFTRCQLDSNRLRTTEKRRTLQVISHP